MCGIVVVIGKNSKKIATELMKKLSHRGEDSCNVITHHGISFAFTRLAINDNSNQADQPFEFENYIGLFNAEIYNHHELRDRYKLQVKSEADTEIILPLYSQYGEKILDLLDGFYASVIYDKNRDELIVMRDYLGKKPLFLAYDDEHTYICSELKVLPKIEYFEMIPKGISKIVKNKLALVKAHENSMTKRGSSEQLKKMIENAIFKRVVDIKDKKVGVFLSGGLDSSILATVINRMFPYTNIHYYSILDSRHPDYEYIKIMHKALHLTDDSYTMIELPSKKEFISIIKQVVYHTESYNPSIISNGIGTYILSKQAHEDGIKVVLTGDGADEMFMGYYDQDTLEESSVWRENHKNLINDLVTTELRRVDLTSMASSIEIRCPFLDRDIYNLVETFNYEDLFGNSKDKLNKNILRKFFKEELPKEIYSRKKVSFDVGSGLQKMMVDICREKEISEKDYLQSIWNDFFKKTLSQCSSDSYFYAYPAFDEVIPFRGKKYL